MNLEFLGMLCLGAYVGGILNYGLGQIKNDSTFKEIVTTIFSAAFAGSVFLFLQLLINKEKSELNPDTIYVYPVGLILALLWAQVPYSIKERIKSEHTGLRIVGWGHLILILSITLYILIKLIINADKIF